jgi:hypothetical protein
LACCDLPVQDAPACFTSATDCRGILGMR